MHRKPAKPPWKSPPWANGEDRDRQTKPSLNPLDKPALIKWVVQCPHSDVKYYEASS